MLISVLLEEPEKSACPKGPNLVGEDGHYDHCPHVNFTGVSSKPSPNQRRKRINQKNSSEVYTKMISLVQVYLHLCRVASAVITAYMTKDAIDVVLVPKR